ncbi:MAG: hypothetical protein ACI90V_011700, partial [Bacillariaceae sp.]
MFSPMGIHILYIIHWRCQIKSVMIEMGRESKWPTRNKSWQQSHEKSPRNPVRFLPVLRFRFERQDRRKNKTETYQIQTNQNKVGPQ